MLAGNRALAAGPLALRRRLLEFALDLGGPGTSYTKGGGMETVVGAIAIAFMLWWLAEEFQQNARRNRALEFARWCRRRGANLLSLRELIGEDRRVIAHHRELH